MQFSIYFRTNEATFDYTLSLEYYNAIETALETQGINFELSPEVVGGMRGTNTKLYENQYRVDAKTNREIDLSIEQVRKLAPLFDTQHHVHVYYKNVPSVFFNQVVYINNGLIGLRRELNTKSLLNAILTAVDEDSDYLSKDYCNDWIFDYQKVVRQDYPDNA